MPSTQNRICQAQIDGTPKIHESNPPAGFPNSRLPMIAPGPGPKTGFSGRVWQNDMAANAAGKVPVAMINDRLGLGLEVVN